MSTYPVSDLIGQLDRDYMVTLLQKLVSIPSVNPFDEPANSHCRELEIADYYEAEMQSLGLLTSRRDVVDGRPNIFGRIKGNGAGPCIMLAGHLDTVGVEGYDMPFDPVINHNRVYGRGSCDMKAGLAAFLETARIIQHNNIELAGDLLIAGIADEEHHMIGSREIRRNGPIPDFAIVGEPTELAVCHAHKGQLCMHIRTYGRACHSSVPEQGVNAIRHMAALIGAFDDYNDELMARDADPVCGHGRFNPGVIRGGDIASSVPGWCELEVDRRLVVGESVDQVVSEYRRRIDPLVTSLDEFSYDVGEPSLHIEPLHTAVDSPIVSHIARAYRDTLGRNAAFNPFPGGTDAPNLMAPAVICGPGSIQQAHTLDEYVEIDQLAGAAAIYLRTILAMQQPD